MTRDFIEGLKVALSCVPSKTLRDYKWLKNAAITLWSMEKQNVPIMAANLAAARIKVNFK